MRARLPIVSLLAAVAVTGMVAAAGAAPAATPARPNLVVVLLDDTRADGIDRMSITQSRLAGAGVTFRQAFVPCPTCCPSRASLLTGLYARHHGTRTTMGALGGADRFRLDGADRQTIAVWLRDAGYTTGLFGKYLNEYTPSEGGMYIPPGWDRWRAFVAPEQMGGVHGASYRIVDERGTITSYGDHSSDAQYATDQLGSWLREFVAEAVAAKRPFFALYAPYASHGDPIMPAPAVRHQDALPDLPPWRPPSWQEPDVRDKPDWVGRMPADFNAGFTDAIRRRAYQSLLAVDEQIGQLLDQLAALGVADRTVVVLTSDNGSTWGDHRQFMQAKGCPYEECIRVPMIIRPAGGSSARLSDAAALNIDLAPTLAALAGVAVPVPTDGRSLVPWLAGESVADWRRDFLLEYTRNQRSAGIIYNEQPLDGDQLRLIYGEPRQSQLFEFDADGQTEPGTVPVRIGTRTDLTFFELGVAVTTHVPQTSFRQDQDSDLLFVIDTSPTLGGITWRSVRDAGHVIDASSRPLGPPDYTGVRDVARGYTYVEYATGERELYDLDSDPWQLDNRADDPAYAAVRAELAARLAELLATPPR